MKIDVTFDFKAQHMSQTVWVTINQSGTIEFLPDEWEAFKSMLQPSKKADFTITELDEKGNRI